MLKNYNFFKKITKLNVIPVVYLYNSGKIDRYFNTKKTAENIRETDIQPFRDKSFRFAILETRMKKYRTVHPGNQCGAP